MKTFALVENNLVTNVSIANDDWQKENWIDCKNKTVGIGYTYDADADVFIAPQPYPSWIRSGSFWNAPTPHPQDNKIYFWDEESLEWQES
jgi:hypothetical protein